MKTRAVILAGGEGSRLGALTAKRTKPAVPFAGKYRIIDFPLSNCVNSGIFDVMVLAQYRPQSLIEHIGAGAPWDLNRDFTGGIKILTPYKARNSSDWYAGTADAVQQNFGFIKQGEPDFVLILSGDHIYTMDYDAMISFHIDHQADLTVGTIRVPKEEASRFGILSVNDQYEITSFVEKPANPQSNLVNMGVYLFNRELLDRVLWEDRQRKKSTHDFGKDIIPYLVKSKARVFAFPYSGYWMDVGTAISYWQAHMDLLSPSPQLKLYDRSWVVHTRTEERPPARIPASGNAARRAPHRPRRRACRPRRDRRWRGAAPPAPGAARRTHGARRRARLTSGRGSGTVERALRRRGHRRLRAAAQRARSRERRGVPIERRAHARLSGSLVRGLAGFVRRSDAAGPVARACDRPAALVLSE